MKLEDQVVSLELAKRLKELEVKQESLFFWTDGMRYDGAYDLVYRHAPLVKEGGGKIDTLSAFTVAELGEMFPAVIATGHTLSQLGTGKTTNEYGYGCALIDANRITVHKAFQADTEADARAKMLIYLIENKLITL